MYNLQFTKVLWRGLNILNTLLSARAPDNVLLAFFFKDRFDWPLYFLMDQYWLSLHINRMSVLIMCCTFRGKLISSRVRIVYSEWALVLGVILSLAEVLTLCSTMALVNFVGIFCLTERLPAPVFPHLWSCRRMRLSMKTFSPFRSHSYPKIMSSNTWSFWSVVNALFLEQLKVKIRRSVKVNKETDFSTALEMAWIALDSLLQWGVLTLLLAFQFARRQVQTVGACFA